MNVIPVTAGIQGFRWIVYPGFHRRDDAFFLTDL